MAEEGASENELRRSSIFDILSSMAILLTIRVCLSTEFGLMMEVVFYCSTEDSRSRKNIFSTRKTVKSSRALLLSVKGVGVVFTLNMLCRGNGIEGGQWFENSYCLYHMPYGGLIGVWTIFSGYICG